MNNYNITHRKADDKKTNQLVYSGELSFNHIQNIYQETESLIKTYPNAEILVEDADILDLSFIQLLIALKKTNQYIIKINLNEDLNDLIKVSGIHKYLIEEKSS